MAIIIKNEKLISPLRYPGSKKWIVSYLSTLLSLKINSIECLIEPFAGGASASLSLLHQGLVRKIALNERDPLISSFWKTLFNDTDWLIDTIKNTKVTLEKWKYFKNLKPRNTRDKAFKCIYLNRTSFSGILNENAGPLGGMNQDSIYKIDCRFNKNTIIKRIQHIAEYRNCVSFIWDYDWVTVFNNIQHLQRKGKFTKSVLFYVDPPFYKKGKRLYRYYFDHQNHIELRNFLINLNQPWILSYDLCPEIIQMYKDGGLNACNVNIIYTTSNNRKNRNGKEVIISNIPLISSEIMLGKDKYSGTNKALNSHYMVS